MMNSLKIFDSNSDASRKIGRPPLIQVISSETFNDEDASLDDHDMQNNCFEDDDTSRINHLGAQSFTLEIADKHLSSQLKQYERRSFLCSS